MSTDEVFLNFLLELKDIEANAAKDYGDLSESVSDKETKTILETIRDDEIRHEAIADDMIKILKEGT